MDSPPDFVTSQLTGANSSYWRVDWFGYVKYASNSGRRRTQPLVDVHLSKLDTLHTHNKPRKVPLERRLIPVPVEFLTLIRIGDVWQDGRLAHIPDYEELSLSFHPEHSTTQMAGTPKDSAGKEFWLPANCHPYHMKATKSFCERLSISTDEHVIFPHYVILQAYFSRSSYVFRKIFQYGLQMRGLHNRTKSAYGDGNPAYLSLNKLVPGSAAEEVARMVFDPAAERAINLVSENLSLQQTNQQPIRPRTLFPYNQYTNLKVRGQWYPINPDEKVFVVFDIIQCSSSFPFQSLLYGYENKDGNTDEYPKNNSENDQNVRIIRQPAIDDEIELDLIEEPGFDLGNLNLPSRSSTEFTDLNDKTVRKVELTKSQDMGSCNAVIQSKISCNSASFGDGDQSGTNSQVSTNSPVDDEDKEDKSYYFKNRICRLDLFENLLAAIKDSEKIESCTLLTIKSKLKTEDFYTFPKAYTPRGNEKKWRYINYVKGLDSFRGIEKTPRRCCIAHIQKDGLNIYLFESERRILKSTNGWKEYDKTSILKVISINEIGQENIESILSSASGSQGGWDLRNIPVDYHETIKHPDNDTIESGIYIESLKASILPDI